MYASHEKVPEHPVDGTFATIVPVEGIGYLAVATDPAGYWAGAGAGKTPASALIDLTLDKLDIEKPRAAENIPVLFPSVEEPVEDFGNPAELKLDDGDVPEYEPED